MSAEIDQIDTESGLIAWFARNHVAANLLMLLIMVVGAYSTLALIRTESFPSFEIDTLTVRIAYPGAAPTEVEQGVTLRVEEAIKGIDGVEEVRSVSYEGTSRVTVEVAEGFEVRHVLDDVKSAVDAISAFPIDIERPIIRQNRAYRDAISVSVYGDLAPTELKAFTQRIENEILSLPEVSTVSLWGERPSEIAVEISEHRLREYNLTLEQVAQAIRNYSLDLPGGAIRARTGDIRLRAKEQAYSSDEFGDVILLTQADGTRIRLRDLAEITDGFTEAAYYARFNGKPALVVSVNTTEDESEIMVANAVRNYVQEKKQLLPDGISIDTWSDSTYYLKGRMNMMFKNMLMGAVLVILILGLFLRPSVAFLVILGLPVAFFGALMLMPTPWIDVSINVISLFGFILVLGVVVDDAIVIAESSYAEIERSGYSRASVVRGARRVAMPATFGVLTTIAAFAPLLLVSGGIARIVDSISWVVIFCLLFSLVESKLILPAHLSALRGRSARSRRPTFANRWLQRFRVGAYEPLLQMAIRNRYACVSLFIAVLLLVFGTVGGGILRFAFFPKVDSDFLRAEFELQEGVPDSLSETVIRTLTTKLEAVETDWQRDNNDSSVQILDNVFAWTSDGKSGNLFVELEKSEKRPLSTPEVERLWRAKVGEIPGVRKLSYSSAIGISGGAAIALKILSRDAEELRAAAGEIASRLGEFEGVYDVENSAAAVTPEIRIRLKPEASTLGLTLASLARQVRQAFYGVEAQRIQRDLDEVRVMVRYPRAGRSSIGDLENMWVRAPSGEEVPFSSVAERIEEHGEEVIRRVNSKRAATVTADVNLEVTSPRNVTRTLLDDVLPELRAKYPSLSVELDGSSQDENEGLLDVLAAFGLAMFALYALLAIPLRSYSQPLLIMMAIPFGIIGALLGHLLLDLTISFVSIMGIVALSGVVVNDALIMVEVVNRKTAVGIDRIQAAIRSGSERLRPIILTSLTTFFGLAPIMLETSLQAQIVIPMAVSLAFGILFSTVITLILIPCLYLIGADIKGLWSRTRSAPETAQPFPTPTDAATASK